MSEMASIFRQLEQFAEAHDRDTELLIARAREIQELHQELLCLRAELAGAIESRDRLQHEINALRQIVQMAGDE